MPLVSLAAAKSHLRILHEDEDSQIELYTAAAESIVSEYLDRVVLPTGETLPEDDVYAMNITPAITAAVLLLVGDLYENREADPDATGNAVLPKAVRALLAPWRVWRMIDEEICDDTA